MDAGRIEIREQFADFGDLDQATVLGYSLIPGKFRERQLGEFMRRSTCARRWRLLAALVLLAGLTESLNAATDTWTGTIDTNWGTTSPGTNWNTTNIPAIPINGDTLIYDGPGGTSTNNTVTINSLGGITFAANAGSYVLTGATPITLTGPLTVVSGNSSVQE